MSFLVIKENKVTCTEDGMTLKEVSNVFNKDKTGKGKTYFNEVINAIYYLYKPRGVYWNKPMQERIEIVNSDHLKDHRWEQLIKMDGVPAIVEKYIDLSYTINDRLEESLKKDINELMRALNEVPTTIEYQLSEKSRVFCDDDAFHVTTVVQSVTIPNFEGKKKLWDYSLSLSKSLKEVQANLKEEETQRETQEALDFLYSSREKNKRQIE